MKIFIPLLGIVATEFEIPDSSEADLKALAKIDQGTNEFKGQQFTAQDLDDYIVTTDEFDVEFPDHKQAYFKETVAQIIAKLLLMVDI